MDATARKFLRAAKQRYSAATFLFRASFHLDAIYLSGYGIECALKALLIERTSVRSRAGLLDSELFRTKRGHNLESLATAVRKTGHPFPAQVLRNMVRATTWSSDLRYEVGLVRQSEAKGFLVAAQEIIEWVERSV